MQLVLGIACKTPKREYHEVALCFGRLRKVILPYKIAYFLAYCRPEGYLSFVSHPTLKILTIINDFMTGLPQFALVQHNELGLH